MTNGYPQRSDSTELPSAAELFDILKNESQRKAVRFDFIQNNQIIFNAHRALSKLAGSDNGWIDQYEEMSVDVLEKAARKNHDELASYIIRNVENGGLYEQLYTALIPKEEQSKTEGIFVFGAATNARIERAVELYKDGIAPKIIISGNSPHYVDDAQAEANRMAVYAIEHSVPGEALILEESSITLPDNVKRTIDLFESMNWQPASLTIVASNFVLMRATMEWYKFCPWEVYINAVAAHPQSEKFTAEGWYKDEATIALVLNEYAKIVLESKIDALRRDGEIE